MVGDSTFQMLSNGRDVSFLQEIGLLVRLLTKGPVDRTTLLELIAQLGIQLRCSFNPQVGVS